VGVGDDQLHPTQPAGFQRAQERGPERAVLAVANGEPEDLPPAIGADAGGDHDRLRHDPVVHPGLAVGRVEEHVGKLLLGKGAVAERADLGVEIRADPAHLGFGDAGVGAQRFDQVVNLAGGDAVQVGLHHDREQRLVHPSAAFQQ
jgi:hypothetical protein